MGESDISLKSHHKLTIPLCRVCLLEHTRRGDAFCCRGSLDDNFGDARRECAQADGEEGNGGSSVHVQKVVTGSSGRI